MARIVGYNFIETRPSDLASTYVHGTQEKIGKLFSQAEESAPTILFIDEMEALVPDRSKPDTFQHYAAEVNEFLVQLNECGERGLLVVGATNMRRSIDPAIRRAGRLDKHIFVGPPDIEARVEALQQFMDRRPQEPIAWFGVAKSMEGCSYAEIEFFVDEAARAALADRRRITTEDLLHALHDNPPTPKGQPEDYL